MRRLRQLLDRHAEAAIAAAAFAAIALIATTVPAWQSLERRVFDLLTVATAKGELSQPITLVAINDGEDRAARLDDLLRRSGLFSPASVGS